MRLAKHLAHAGVASRRGAEAIIAEGRVTVDGEIIRDPARDVTGTEKIEVDFESVGRTDRKRVVFVLNKPPGVVSTAKDTHGRTTVVELVDHQSRLYPVGRLDADARGLILLTDDGDLAHLMTHPSFEVEKTYRVKVARGPITDTALRRLRAGVKLDDGPTAPAKVRRLSPTELELTIHEGRNRQVKRMCETVGHRVVELKRVSFGSLELGTMREGTARRLKAGEIDALRRLAEGGPSRRGAR